MARKPAGKPLTLRAIRVDADVWAVILKLKSEHKTINEGLRLVLLKSRLKHGRDYQKESDA